MANVLLGNHPSIQKIRELITMVSGMALNVLLLGETGTGKDVVARLLYSASSRQKKRFVKINCAALPLSLLESELFGYEKGAFTGADRLKPGKFELAAGGVIFLDEVGDMPLTLQAKLLNVLQSGEYNRLGGTRNIKADAWVITSTNHDLNKDIRDGLFREDLFYRLNIIKIDLPPLRERKEDIPILTDYFVRKNLEEMKVTDFAGIDSGMVKLFNEYHWPGNVRELSSIILKLVIGESPSLIRHEIEKNMKGDGKSVFDTGTPSDKIPQDPTDNGSQKINYSLKEIKANTSRYIEKKAITYVLQKTAWNKSKAAKLLKISYKTLFTKMHDLGIDI